MKRFVPERIEAEDVEEYKGCCISKSWKTDEKGKRIPGTTRYMVSEDEDWVGDVYKTLKEARQYVDETYASTQVKGRRTIYCSIDFQKIDQDHFIHQLFSCIKQLFPKNCDPKTYFNKGIELQNVPSHGMLLRNLTKCLNSMGYDVYHDIEVEALKEMESDVQSAVAAVDSDTHAWVELILRWYMDDNAAIEIDANKGDVTAEDWYEED